MADEKKVRMRLKPGKTLHMPDAEGNYRQIEPGTIVDLTPDQAHNWRDMFTKPSEPVPQPEPEGGEGGDEDDDDGGDEDDEEGEDDEELPPETPDESPIVKRRREKAAKKAAKKAKK